MATLTPTEQTRLGRVRPELFQAVLWLFDNAKSQLGFTLAIPENGGVRSTATQTALYNDSLAQGGGTLAYPVGKPGTSRHEKGAAFDAHIVAGGSNDDGTGSDDDYERLAALGESFPGDPGLTAGYFFAERHEAAKSDPYHFQLAEDFADSDAKWKAMQRAGIITASVIVGLIGLGLVVTR